MIQLIYASSATTPFGEAELTDLLKRARVHNASVGVTGLLLFDQGTFLQVLEGPEDAVRTLYDKIALDRRHDKVLLLFDGPIEERVFDEWKMGFVDVAARGLRDLPGFTDFFNPNYYLEAKQPDGSLARKTLERFRDGGFRRSVR